MDQKIRVGIIGAGLMGDIHTAALHALSNADIVGIADIDLSRAKAVAQKFEVKHVFADYNELLAMEGVNAVVIATPEPFHKDPAIAAAEAGKHILLEKPIATTLQDSDAIINAARRSGVKLQIGYCCRFDTTHAEIKTRIDNGFMGDILHVFSRRHASINEARRLQGRVTIDEYLAVHDADLLLWYLNDDVVRVSAEIVQGPVYEEFGQHDMCCITLKTKRGAVGVIEVGWVLPEKLGRGGDLDLKVIGSKSVAYATVYPTPLVLCGPDGWEFPDVLHWTSLHGQLVGFYREQARCFLDAIAKDEEPLVTGEMGRKSLEVVLAAQKSYQSDGQAIALPLEAQ